MHTTLSALVSVKSSKTVSNSKLSPRFPIQRTLKRVNSLLHYKGDIMGKLLEKPDAQVASVVASDGIF